MNEKLMNEKVEYLISDIRNKIANSVPKSGDFPMVYSEFKVTDREMCLTDVILKLSALPHHQPSYQTGRWLEVVGYRLPIPYKATRVIFKGTKDEVLMFLDSAEALNKIRRAIPDLDFNLSDY